MHKDRTIDIEEVTFKSPVFLNGKNFGMRASVKESPGLVLTYDRDDRELEVTYKGKKLYLPSETMAGYLPVGAEALPKHDNPGRNPAVTAQVETPMSHVHGGLGKGRTGQDPKVRL